MCKLSFPGPHSTHRLYLARSMPCLSSSQNRGRGRRRLCRLGYRNIGEARKRLYNFQRVCQRDLGFKRRGCRLGFWKIREEGKRCRNLQRFCGIRSRRPRPAVWQKSLLFLLVVIGERMSVAFYLYTQIKLFGMAIASLSSRKILLQPLVCPLKSANSSCPLDLITIYQHFIIYDQIPFALLAIPP